MGKRGHIQLEEERGPVPSWRPPLTEKEQERGRAVQALLRLVLDARYFLGGSKPLDEGRKIPDEWGKFADWVPSSRKVFERDRAEFHQKIEDALLGSGDPSYLHFLANQIAIFEDRKDLPALPRGERAKTVIGECFFKLWTEGENWLTRKEFFDVCCTELKAQNCHTIKYRHFVRILENTGLDEHFPPMRQRRKHSKRLNRSIDS